MIDRQARREIKLLRRIQLIEGTLTKMQNRIQALLDATAAAEAGEQSAIELIRGFIDVVAELRAEVASQGFDPSSVDKALAALTAKTNDLAAAVMAGQTAEAPPASPPVVLPAVPQPPVAPPVDVPPVAPVASPASDPAAPPAAEPAPVPEMTVAPEGEVKAPDAPPPGTPTA